MGRRPDIGDGPDWVQPQVFESGASPGWSEECDVGQRGAGGGRPGGQGRPGPGRGPSRSRWAVGILGVAALIVIVTAVVRHSQQQPVPQRADPAPTTSALASSTAGSPSGSSATGGATTSARLLTRYPPVTRSDSPLLPEMDAPFTVYGFTAGDDDHPPTVMRLDPRTGTEVDTTLPPLASTGPVSVLAEPHGVIVRPLDAVPGYRVGDGEPPSPLRGLLAGPGPALPGPDPGTVWIPDARGSPRQDAAEPTGMTLVDADGHALGPHVSLGQGDPGMPLADGAGGVMLAGGDGSLNDLEADRTVTTVLGPAGQTVTGVLSGADGYGPGRLIAAGPTGFAYLPCPTGRRCQLTYAARDGTMRTMNLPAEMGTVLYGALSPDGTHLALAIQPQPSTGHPTEGAVTGSPAAPALQGRPDDDPVLAIVDLQELDSWRAPWITLNPDSGAPALAWTPDSGWLLAATGNQQLMAVQGDTHEVRTISVWAGTLTALAVRPGA
jgi:hypothetical protein